MPASAVKNTDGSVTLADGTVLSAADLAAANSARPVVTPIKITTGSGRVYGKGTISDPARYGIWFDGVSFHWLDENGDPIPGTSWRVRNLNRMKLEFSKAA